MFELFNKTVQLLPVKVSEKEAKITPLISDPQLLSQKRLELQDLIKKAVVDGEITTIEYDEIQELTKQVGVNNFELNEMIKIEFKNELKSKIQLFVEDDGIIDKSEMTALLNRAKTIGLSKQDLNMYINEALSKYEKEENKRKEEENKRKEEEYQRQKEKTNTFLKIAAGVLGVAAIALGATAGKTVLTTAQQGNLKLSFSSSNNNTTKREDVNINENKRVEKTSRTDVHHSSSKD